ncbi:tyrosine-type recombinase/integrase [Cupriavidus agavae]|uniref:Site-specific recombinase XerD n=1 Tax=Cupriavidus agavae TaxID=1001822 RepID=A0A4Q7S141_9BURK|nr:tyrosine-type recombinase/integrase [Cupriavidus agavae]RZT39090.1 site-specific recombinase XerD [Cupriavidus agavae]
MSEAVSRAGTPLRRRQRPPVAPARQLGPHHFAFYRGYLQGLDPGRLSGRYLGPGLDLRQARSTLVWIEDELARGVGRLATRPRHDGEAALLTAPAWLALIHGRPQETAAARQARQRKLLRALDALQPLLLARPQPGDAVAGWFSPAVAGKLDAAGWPTLGVLQAAIATAPRQWFRGAHGIGAATARAIEAWLRGQSFDTAGTGHEPVAPLEALAHGPAAADAAAIAEWLNGHAPETSHTWRAYRSQAERFLLWVVHARGRTLADLGAEDGVAYLHFLADPQPAAQWVGKRGTPRDQPEWRPFEGPLSASSIRHAAKIVRMLCGWLVATGRIPANPFHAATQPAPAAAPRIDAARSFSAAQWQYLKSFVATLPPEDPRTVRLRFMFRLLHATGLRVSEQVRATLGDLRPVGGWVLDVPGARPRSMALPETVVDALRDHMEARGLGRDIERLPPATPLIGRVRDATGDGTLSVAQISAIWKRCFARAGLALAADDAAGAAHLARASAHWLRHTAGAHALARGMSRQAVQRQLGHASIDTTAAYADPALH